MMGTASEREKYMMTCDKQRFDKGFTLGELLIVVAIVLVLVAIAVPVFTGAMANAEEATCDANRRSLKGALADAYILDNKTEPTQATLDKYVENFMGTNGNKPLCPAEGNYTLDADFANGRVIVKCSVHGVTMDEEIESWLSKFTGKYTSDDDIREAYAADKGIKEWPSVTGTDGKTLYLQFKSYHNNANKTFLYAGPSSTIKNSNSWWAKYICDSSGLIGKAGQWYEMPKVENVAMYGGEAEEKLKALLNNGKPVNLVNGEFVAA